MKLYYTKGACSLAARILIHEMGIKCKYESVDLTAKRTETGKDYWKINPKGAVPALELDNGEILTENTVIHQYLADISNATQLLPPVGNFKRYRVLEWLNYIATEVHKSAGVLFNPTFPQEIKDKIIKPLLKSKISYIDKHLSSNKYLLGDHFTLPDAYLFVMISWTIFFKIDPKEWQNIYRYFLDLNKRPSIHESIEEEGLNLSTV